MMPENDHRGPRSPALRGRPAPEPGQCPGRRPGHGRANVARGHPGPLDEHPDRGRAPAHHPRRVSARDFLIVDGTDGEVIINPPPTLQKEFLGKKKKYDAYRRDLKKAAAWKAETLDGVRFTPLANIELPEEIGHALSYGAEGIGLFRSEFIYLQRRTLPSEQDHYEIYARLAREVHPRPVYIRTIDIGGEKTLPQLSIQKEPNPALGLAGDPLLPPAPGPVPDPASGHHSGRASSKTSGS